MRYCAMPPEGSEIEGEIDVDELERLFLKLS